jgi:aspartate kinase
MRIVVQKFGGTSLKTAAQRDVAASWVERARGEGFRPVVVVSAMGRRGDPYATDTLLELLGPTAAGRTADLIASCGETIAAAVMADVLDRRGIPAEAFTGGQAGIVTDAAFGEARILRVDPRALLPVLEAGAVPVVAGFQGVTEDGAVTTLGRGGSDTTAAALGAALKADVVEIFTDVDGIKTADPRLVPTARTLEALDYDDVFQMAHLGARVVHPRAVEIARQFQVPLRIRSTFSPSPGTLVTTAAAAWDPWAHRDPASVVSGVTYLAGLVQVECRAPGGADPDWALDLFRRLARRGVSVDLINVFPDRVYFTIPATRRRDAEPELSAPGLDVRLYGDRAKVSVVGSAIHGLPGVMAEVMAALSQAGVPVLQTADSHSTISCLVAEDHLEQAVRALHARFGLDTAPGSLVGAGGGSASAPEGMVGEGTART